MTSARHRRRKGNVLILTLFLMIGMLGFLAFAVDLGYLMVARSELQRTADAAALAACWELVDPDAALGKTDSEQMAEAARASAKEYVAYNRILQDSAELAAKDVEVGYYSGFSDPSGQLAVGSYMTPNSVRVRVRRTGEQNGEVPLFFARVLGFHSHSVEAEATAALISHINGFRNPSDGSNLGILPFALDLGTWKALLEGAGTDNWKWSAELGKVVAGTDGVLEVNMYPQGMGAPGNRGTVDVGSNNNSTADISRQILHGVTKSDLDYHGGKLEFNEQGKLFLNGDTGISAGFKEELDAIKGQPRIIPIFSELQGNGNNATYTIVQFVGVRVMDVQLTGSMSSKRLIIQPAAVITRGIIPGESTERSEFVYSPVTLVR